MAIGKKIERIAAFRLEPGKNIGTSVWAFGGTTINALGTTYSGIPYLGISPKGLSAVTEDESIDGSAFKSLPVQTGLSAEVDGFTGNCKYQGIDALLYWMLGYEDGGSSPQSLHQFTVSGITVDPTHGATYTNNSATFTVYSTSLTAGVGTILCERTTGTNDPSGDTLSKASGTGDATITFSASNSEYSSHLFELDEHERGSLAYRTAEQTASDYSANDRKNRYATLGVKEGPNDHRYPFYICNGFSFTSNAGEIAKWDVKGLAYREDRGDYDSANWTIPADVQGSALSVVHHQLTVSLGESGSLTEIGISDINMSVDTPIRKDQDTESGLYINEPVMEGRYEAKVDLTLSRHSVDTWLAFRDSHTTLALKVIATYGIYAFEFYFPQMKILDTSVAEGDVMTEPISLVSGDPTANPFTDEIGSHNLIENGVCFIRVVNKNNVNEMRRE